MPFFPGVSKFVLEGAPGQGKSTVTQFLCQINRIRFLNKAADLNAIADQHKNTPTRLPFRIDLRDFALWIANRHPYAKDEDIPIDLPTRKSLESFLTMQVSWYSGGLNISQDELLSILSYSHAVIILDGFDEVANIQTRNRIVEEIREGAARLSANAMSVQLIVTSRPAAFANLSSFPEDEWVHLELTDLRYANIEAYRDKWTRGQGLSLNEATQIRETLSSKLEQPHLRELARNPMQLSILLHLIHVHGVALPEKRTTLYEEYIKLFFNREAEKSPIVRNHRELLLAIHGLLAWRLHAEAEQHNSSGSISRERLNQEVKAYLEAEEHDADLAKELFTGTVERVCALVSRVEGTFEFEVQPLREYFAARHLYMTASNATVGQQPRGTTPERFRALAQSSYWTNVTRFYCGFYSPGEISSLVDEITGLAEDEKFALINQPRRLAIMLLSDRVFSQTPRPMKRLMAFVTGEPGFQRFILTSSTYRRGDIALPLGAGQKELFQACTEKLRTADSWPQHRAFCRVISDNADMSTLKGLWLDRSRTGSNARYSLFEASTFGIVDSLLAEEANALFDDNHDTQIQWLIQTDKYEEIANDKALLFAAAQKVLMGTLSFPYRWRETTNPIVNLEALTLLIRSRNFVRLLSENRDGSAISTVLRGNHPTGIHRLLERYRASVQEDEVYPSLDKFVCFVVERLGKSVKEWRTSLTHWSAVVDRGFEECKASQVMIELATLASATFAQGDDGTWNKQGFSPTKGLVERLYYARNKVKDEQWWFMQLRDVTDEGIVSFLTILLNWGTPDLISKCKNEIEQLLVSLTPEKWTQIRRCTELLRDVIKKRRTPLSKQWLQSVGTMSPELAFLILDRIKHIETARRLARSSFSTYHGDNWEILRIAEKMEIQDGENTDLNWDHIITLSARAKSLGIDLVLPTPRSRRLNVPVDVAKVVLTESDKHSGRFIAMCEQVYANHVSQGVPRVSSIAESQQWFAPPR